MAKEYFPFTGKIPFEGKDSKNVMAFHYYEPEKVVMGKKMKDWLKFVQNEKYSTKSGDFLRFFAYLCHVIDDFACLDLQH